MSARHLNLRKMNVRTRKDRHARRKTLRIKDVATSTGHVLMSCRLYMKWAIAQSGTKWAEKAHALGAPASESKGTNRRQFWAKSAVSGEIRRFADESDRGNRGRSVDPCQAGFFPKAT